MRGVPAAYTTTNPWNVPLFSFISSAEFNFDMLCRFLSPLLIFFPDFEQTQYIFIKSRDRDARDDAAQRAEQGNDERAEAPPEPRRILVL